VLILCRKAFENADKYGGNKSKFYTIGSSAGGCLALTTANKLVENPETRSSIHGVVALVPPTTHPDNVPSEYISMYKSYAENADDAPIIDRSSMETYFGM
jgi:versiconal hemiacetal acetate esterase